MEFQKKELTREYWYLSGLSDLRHFSAEIVFLFIHYKYIFLILLSLVIKAAYVFFLFLLTSEMSHGQDPLMSLSIKYGSDFFCTLYIQYFFFFNFILDIMNVMLEMLLYSQRVLIFLLFQLEINLCFSNGQVYIQNLELLLSNLRLAMSPQLPVAMNDKNKLPVALFSASSGSNGCGFLPVS